MMKRRPHFSSLRSGGATIASAAAPRVIFSPSWKSSKDSDFKGALKLLANRAGVPLEGYNKEEESEKDRLYKVMEESALYFTHNLEGNAEALSYLKSRGLEEKL